MDLFTNPYIANNFSLIAGIVLTAFIIAFLLTPLMGKLALKIGALDLPARLRTKGERGIATRIHEYVYPKLGGLAVVSAILITLFLNRDFVTVGKGVILGIIIIAITGFLDDKFELNSKLQLLGQLLAAAIVVASGISITSINFLDIQLHFDWFSTIIRFAGFTYNFIFPADILTILWIVGLINVVNWVGGVDALNGSVTSIALVTLLLINLANGNIVLAALIGIHLGATLGVLPFNYPPGKIMYGSIGDYINGFLLAVFAILGSTKWTASLIILAMPIIDGILVVYMRFKSNPELIKTPLKILQISDKNHLHHRLLDAGYSKKTVTLIETAMMVVVCTIALIFSNLRTDVLAFILGIAFIFVSFAVVFVLKKRGKRRSKADEILDEMHASENPEKEIVIKTVYDDEKDDEKFIY
ncbi:undecaprenyl/decaprenyl-phosphate alpha-N-acetylglucosaminyl 1-phosphate transferase [Candidatus Dojkabacteria bacterium]|nr:undecaprenyl/decaprenyl-phosphate alpha-N-acetylglucosaminyl 1-phosphate transferase [Candidatus Dojkabacteria bacterium]